MSFHFNHPQVDMVGRPRFCSRFFFWGGVTSQNLWQPVVANGQTSQMIVSFASLGILTFLHWLFLDLESPTWNQRSLGSFLTGCWLKKCSDTVSSSHHLEAGDESSLSRNCSGALPNNTLKHRPWSSSTWSNCHFSMHSNTNECQRVSTRPAPCLSQRLVADRSNLPLFSQGFQQDLSWFFWREGWCQLVNQRLLDLQTTFRWHWKTFYIYIYK